MSDEKTLVGAVKTEQGVEVKGMLMQPVVEKCEGCDRVRTFEEQQFCGSYPNPRQEVVRRPLQLCYPHQDGKRQGRQGQPVEGVQACCEGSLSRSEAFCSRGCTAIFLRTPVFGKGVLPRQGRLRLPPFLFSEAVHEEHMTRFSRLIESIGQQRDKVIEYQTRMTELPALGPENGGTAKCPKPCIWKGCCVSSA